MCSVNLPAQHADRHTHTVTELHMYVHMHHCPTQRSDHAMKAVDQPNKQ